MWLFSNLVQSQRIKTSMFWTKKKPKQTQKNKNTLPRAQLLQRTFSVLKSLPGMSCHREQLHTAQALWLPAVVVGTQTHGAKSPTMWASGWHLTWHWAHPPIQSLLHTTSLLLPCLRGRQQQEWMLTGDILLTRGPRGSEGTTVHRGMTLLTGHCRQLQFLSQNFFSSGIQTALTGRFALSATE